MKIAPKPTPGPGPRYPGQPGPTITPRRRWKMRELRGPFHHTDRLQVLDYRLTPAMANCSRTYSYALLLLAGQFGFEAQITRDGDDFWLELPMFADDYLLQRAIPMEYPPALLATLWHRLEQKHIREKARQSRRGAGRN